VELNSAWQARFSRHENLIVPDEPRNQNNGMAFAHYTQTAFRYLKQKLNQCAIIIGGFGSELLL